MPTPSDVPDPTSSPSTPTEISAPLLISFGEDALCSVPSLPPGTALPGGLTTSVCPPETFFQKYECPAVLDDVILLRLKTSLLTSEKEDVRDSLCRLLTTSLLFIDDVQLLPDSTLPTGLTSPTALRLFDSPASDAPLGVAFERLESLQRRNVDCVAYVNRGAGANAVCAAIVDAAFRMLAAVDEVKGAEHVDHFAVLPRSIVLSLAVSRKNASDEEGAESTDHRRRIHRGLGLPLNRVLMRRSCRLFRDPDNDIDTWDGGHPGRLRDVHIGIKPPDLSNASVHTITDSYLYAHYSQDRLHDAGWGCAYRSLQTLLSWAFLQHYVSFPDGRLLSHRAIQSALIDVGDKPASLLGSRDWIGANEVCYALERLTGISSRILHVTRGTEMGTVAGELASHFEEVGAPVMVGGGVLAWTILGVARSEKTDEVRFLILDPHYEGKDELGTIQAKGWVAWRSMDVFRSDAFYNLCLPMRPDVV